MRVVADLPLVNTQPAEKPVHREDGSLEVHGVWLTLQGEGPFSGSPAVFVRLTGCNLFCPACDTLYTGTRELLTPAELLLRVEQVRQGTKINLIVITGGEPFRQYLGPFVRLAESKYYLVQIETNGTLYQNWLEDPTILTSVVCSPKTPTINKELAKHITAYKYVLQAGYVDPFDGLPTSCLGVEMRVARPATKVVYVQPLDECDEAKNKANAQACVESCLKFGYRLSLQQHKILGLD